MNEKTKALLKEPSTWGGIAIVIIAAAGLETLSPEQVGGILAGIAAVILPESK